MLYLLLLKISRKVDFRKALKRLPVVYIPLQCRGQRFLSGSGRIPHARGSEATTTAAPRLQPVPAPAAGALRQSQCPHLQLCLTYSWCPHHEKAPH